MRMVQRRSIQFHTAGARALKGILIPRRMVRKDIEFSRVVPDLSAERLRRFCGHADITCHPWPITCAHRLARAMI